MQEKNIILDKKVIPEHLLKYFKLKEKKTIIHRGYISHLKQIFAEVYRVMKKTGTCWVNIGDTYASTQSGATKEWYQKHGDGVYNRLVGRNTQGRTSEVTPKAKEYGKVKMKSLCLIPERFILMMVDELGFIARNVIIWHKPNPMPESCKDRFTRAFENVYFFSKNQKYYFEQQFEPHQSPIGKPRNKNQESSNQGYPNGDRFSPGERTGYGKQGRNKRNVWTIPTKPSNWDFCENCKTLFKGGDRRLITKTTVVVNGKEEERKVCPICESLDDWVDHFAMFPEALVEPMLSAGCPLDGWVLDPFAGACTVGVEAKKQDKNFVGVDLNPGYCALGEAMME